MTGLILVDEKLQRQSNSIYACPDHVSQEESSASIANQDLGLHNVTPVDVLAEDVSLSIFPLDGRFNPIRRFRSRRPQKFVTTDIESSGPPVQGILTNVNIRFPSGTLTAIIGSSGCGKTSFLNVLAGRIRDAKLQISGRVIFNRSQSLTNAESAYVTQEDCLAPTLTVRETLQYAADLRLPASMSLVDRRHIVESVILELGLKGCAATRIGDNTTRGCSGGEKRRVSLGVQILANPSVIFADEPSTGLDATSAHQLIQTLKTLASKGRTVIMTIHQPRSEIWGLFDRIVLLSQGSVVFSGTTAACTSHFASIGYAVPLLTNPAEYLIDLLAVDARTKVSEATSLRRITALHDAWVLQQNVLRPQVQIKVREFPSRARHPTTHRRISTWQMTKVLASRTILTTIRDPMGLAGSISEAVLMSTATGWIFYQMDGSLAGIRSRQSSFYVACSLQGYLILLYEVYRLTTEITMFDRERSEGVVSPTAFLLSRRVAKLMEDIPIPLIFSTIFYLMAGYRRDAGQFFVFLALQLLVHYVSIAFATLTVALFRDLTTATLMVNLIFTLQSFGCGSLVQIASMPVYVRWLRWAAHVFYANGAMNYNEFAGQFYDCPLDEGAGSLDCLQYTGDFQLSVLGFPSDWIWRPIVILVAFCFGVFCTAWVALTLVHPGLSISQVRPRKEKLVSEDAHCLPVASLDKAPEPVTISLQGLCISLHLRNLPMSSKKVKQILHPISTDFRPGGLNVIMGPSGCGKTSLLLSIAQRLRDSYTTTHQVGGQVLLNGCQATSEISNSIVSMVLQHDDDLLAHLTVRETLQFAARLRLAPTLSLRHKLQRAEEVLMQMGLKPCADHIIGGKNVKGISGGEKRRVTIGVQLLSDPHVLLLDEPTSGLDAFTAQSITDLLEMMARSGRTIVMTIHQSRSNLWPMLQNVLLLARGGHPVYSGPSLGMLRYLETLGYPCPEHANPADFVLDLVTVDIRDATSESATLERVRHLVDAWTILAQKLCLTSRVSASHNNHALASARKSRTPISIALPALMHRSILNFRRERDAAIGRIMQVVGYGIVCALFFAPLKTDYNGVQTRLGYVATVTILYVVGMLQNVAVYPTERAVFYREHEDQICSVEAFLINYTLLEIPFEFAAALLFGVLGGLAVGLSHTYQEFFLVVYCCFCIVNAAESLGIVFNTIFSHAGFAVNITSIILCLGEVMGGSMSINMPSVLRAFNYLNPLKYGLGILVSLAFRGLKFTCAEDQRLPDGHCPIETGEQALALYDLDEAVWVNCIALTGVILTYRLIAFALLKINRDPLLSRF